MNHFLNFIALLISTFCHAHSYERVITELISVYHGVELNFRYNESESISGLVSAPGCPKSEEGHPWLYYATNDSIKCYLVGSKGPCEGERGQLLPTVGMFVVNTTESHYGVCGCDCIDPIHENFDNGTEEEKRERPHRFCRSHLYVTLVFIPQLKECFEVHSWQGPCRDGDYLHFDDDSTMSNYSLKDNEIGSWYGKAYCTYNPFAPSFSASKYIEQELCSAGGFKYSKFLKKCIKTTGRITGIGK